MMRFLKTLLVCLCMLSLPVQGMAALTMSNCAVGHRGMGHQGHEGPHEHEVTSHHQHGVGQPTHAAHLSADKCSACASCCLGVGMVAPVFEWAAAPRPAAKWVSLTHALSASFVPDGLERPPQHVLA